MRSTRKGMEEKLRNIAPHRFMGLENCKGMGGRMEQKDHAVLKVWWWKLQINKSWLRRKPILKYYIALRHSIKSVCTCTIQNDRQFF